MTPTSTSPLPPLPAQSAIPHRPFGASGIDVPVLCFGTAGFGGGDAFFKVWGDVQQDLANRLVGAAIDGGVNFFDTANIYSDGLAETILGNALKGKRAQVILASKSSTPSEKLGVGGASRSALQKSVDDSLRRLQTDYLDILYMHEFDATTPIEETLRALEQLIASGKVRTIGCSNFSGWHTMKAFALADQLALPRYGGQQVSYSLALRDAENEHIPLALDQDMALMCYSPLGGGAVAGNIRRNAPRVPDTRLAKMPELMASPESVVLRVTDAMEQVAADTGKTFAQIALNWVLGRPGVCSAIFAARTEAQLQDNLGALGWQLTPQQIALLDRASEQPPAYPYSHQHQFPTINPPPVPYYHVVKS
jgi:aryl-alcohol dehydrogenase-like predicted oxidoreductase